MSRPPENRVKVNTLTTVWVHHDTQVVNITEAGGEGTHGGGGRFGARTVPGGSTLRLTCPSPTGPTPTPVTTDPHFEEEEDHDEEETRGNTDCHVEVKFLGVTWKDGQCEISQLLVSYR